MREKSASLTRTASPGTRRRPIGDVPLDDVPFAAVAIGDAPPKTMSGLTSPSRYPPTGRRGEELQVGERKIRILRLPIRTSTVTDMAYAGESLPTAGDKPPTSAQCLAA